MNTWLNYALEANAGLLLFLLIYRLLLQNETQFAYRRMYLLAGIVFSLTFPLITVPNNTEIIPSLGYAIPAWEEISPAPIEPDKQPVSAPLTVWTWIAMGYITIVILLVSRFLYQVLRVISLIRKYSGYTNVVTVNDPNVYAFSFFSYIFISNVYSLSHEEKQRIIQHETVHTRRWHSIDMVLMELTRILFWFNPLLKYYKNELSTIHEYEADSVSVKPEDVDQYCRLLARSAIVTAGLSIANHFNNSLTLKRIAMMKTIKKKMKQWKTLMILGVVTLFFVAVSCQDQIVAEMESMSETTSIMGDFPPHLRPEVERIQREHPGVPLMFVEAEPGNADKLNKFSPESILFFNVRKEFDQSGNQVSERVEMIVRSDGKVSELGDLSKSKDEVFLVVEESASPENGMEAFYRELANEIKMPEEARSKGVSGKVFVEMIIEPDGTTSNHKVVKGIGAGCDEEALRGIVAANLKWNPAKQRGVPVRQKYVIPITFIADSNGHLQDQMDQFKSPEQAQPVSENGVFLSVEKSAEPVGGFDALSAEIYSKLRMPAEARRSGISGKVFVEIIVEPDGTTSGHTLIKGIGSGCDEEALRVVSSLSTRWTPGQQDGKSVRQKFVIPITFINTEAVAQTVKDKKMIVSSNVRMENGKPVVTGSVVGADGKPLPGINIVVAGKTYGTVSDRNGNFRLTVEEQEAEIILSFIGYKTERIVVVKE